MSVDIDGFYKQLQSWTNGVPLIVLGSGASVPFKLPTMWALGEHLKKSISFLDPDDKKQFEDFKSKFDSVGDLEVALSELQLHPSVFKQIVESTWKLVNKSDLKAYERIVQNANTFPLARLIQHLVQTATKKVSIITTNYDRLAEYAASLSKAIICTGYAQNYAGHFSSTIHTNNLANLKGYSGQVNIWKVHGSLDWFRTKEDESVHLSLRHSIPKNHTPLIVTPGLTKYYETHIEPYRTIFTQADVEIENANAFLCVGYGFNDVHVQPKLISQIKSGKPIIVLAKQLTPKTREAIITAKCKNYILIEEQKKHSQVYSSNFGDFVINNSEFWSLEHYLKIITA